MLNSYNLLDYLSFMENATGIAAVILLLFLGL